MGYFFAVVECVEMAGHSHWKTIKRAKAANDSKRGKVWSKIARKIIIAAKRGGDPRDNLTLRYVIDEGRAANMPKETIQNAIKKGTGELGAENFEDMSYEGYGPGGVAVLIEALTNNRARTAADVRYAFEFAGGNLGTNGSVRREFNKVGIISVKAAGASEEKLMEVALEAGAEDVKSEEEVFEVMCPPAVYHKVKEAVEGAGFVIEASEVVNVPVNPVAVDAELAAKLLRLVEALEDNDDVQTVSHNAELPEGV